MSNDSEAEEADVDDADADAGAASGGDEAPAEDESEAATEEQDDGEEAAEGLQAGDFVRIDYTARTVEDGNLVDTTDPEVAEEEGVEADQEFAPRTIVLGEGHIFQSVEDDVIGGDVGDAGSVVVPATEAFGEYDEEQVRTVSKDKIPEDDRYPGAQVQIDGQQGQVETIIGGRARVNFNHPLAGEDIEYEWTIVDEVDDREEQAAGLLDMLLDMELDVWFQTDTVEEEQLVEPDEDEADDADESEEGDADDDEAEPPEPETEVVEVEKESLYIDADPRLQMNQQWMMGKQQIGQQLMDLLGVDRVVIQEVIDGAGMGMPGMMGGMGGMGGGGGADVEELLEEGDIDADELAEELEEGIEE
jgi:FKBP-type peptidyl-prolyl cis-trans isomerase SlyD